MAQAQHFEVIEEPGNEAPTIIETGANRPGRGERLYSDEELWHSLQRRRTLARRIRSEGRFATSVLALASAVLTTLPLTKLIHPDPYLLAGLVSGAASALAASVAVLAALGRSAVLRQPTAAYFGTLLGRSAWRSTVQARAESAD